MKPKHVYLRSKTLSYKNGIWYPLLKKDALERFKVNVF